MEEQEKKVLCRLQNLCVRKECCEEEMLAKALKAMDGDEEAAARILRSLVEDQFVSNSRYATAYAREKSAISGWGPVKIRYMLSRKGIDRETVDSALQEMDAGAAQVRLDKLLAARYRQLSADPQCKLKLLRYAMGRGYSYEDVRPVVDRLMSTEKP